MKTTKKAIYAAIVIFLFSVIGYNYWKHYTKDGQSYQDAIRLKELEEKRSDIEKIIEKSKQNLVNIAGSLSYSSFQWAQKSFQLGNDEEAFHALKAAWYFAHEVGGSLPREFFPFWITVCKLQAKRYQEQAEKVDDQDKKRQLLTCAQGFSLLAEEGPQINGKLRDVWSVEHWKQSFEACPALR